MKKAKIMFFLLTFVFIMPLVLCACGKEEAKLNNFNLDLVYDQANHVLSGREEVTYLNTSDNLLQKLEFHLYPNAFRENAKNKVVTIDNETDAYPNGKSFGGITIDTVTTTINNEEKQLDFEIGGEDENLLIVPLETAIYPDEFANLTITFKVQLANINHRLGYGQNVTNFGNFYPIACVYQDGKGFYEDLYHSNGDPFYSDCANYNVKLSYPNNLTLATSGQVVKEEDKNGQKICQIKGDKIRDFAFCLSDNFNKIEKKVGNTLVQYYGYSNDENLSRCIDISAAALKYFSETFGSYPYSNLAVVKTNFIHGGMEYPNLVMISDTCQSQEEEDYVIVHEIAHQWWYGMVGNDEYNHPWLDESLTEYSTLMFFEKQAEANFDYNTLVKSATSNYKFFVEVYTKILGDVDTSMDRPLDKFNTQPEYVNCVYTKGIVMYHTLREMVGQKKFEKALQKYFEKYKFKNAAPEHLIASFSSSTGHNLEGFFLSFINGTAIVM